MIEAKACIARIDRKIDRLHTNHERQIPIVDVCNALTESQWFLTKERAPRFEQDKKVQHELRPLEKKDILIEKIEQSNKVSTIAFPADYFQDTAIRIICAKRGCGRKEIELTKIESGDKGRSLRNPYWQSSFAWEQCFGDIAGNMVYIYNGTDFKVEGMIIDYLMRPPDIHCPSKVIAPEQYVDWNGQEQTRDQGWILDDLVDEGINLAAMFLTSDIGDFRDFQRQLQNNIQTVQTSKL